MILLDTHAAIWAAHDHPALGKQSRSMISVARAEGGLAVSSISAWEIALLASKGRLTLRASAEALWRGLLQTGVSELPITGEIAFASVALGGLHSDPADRFIAATAIVHDATLLTADKSLLRWRHPLNRQNASR